MNKIQKNIRPWGIGFWLCLALLIAVITSGCATHPASLNSSSRPFTFGHDSFTFTNELLWVYTPDPRTGVMVTQHQAVKPEFAFRCFPMAMATRQFFYHAQFAPGLPREDEKECQKKVRQILHRSARHPGPDAKKIVIAGYPDLFAFSRDHEKLLKQECGGAWRSYLQCGHWRMIFPFSRASQQKTAETLAQKVSDHNPSIVHVCTFPALTINHALLIYNATENDREILFRAYDPNNASRPELLIYNRLTRTFTFPATHYFAGGTVSVYEVFRNWCY